MNRLVSRRMMLSESIVARSTFRHDNRTPEQDPEPDFDVLKSVHDRGPGKPFDKDLMVDTYYR